MADNGDTPTSRTTAEASFAPSRVDQIAPPVGATDGKRLGDELPVFCEQCGYSLHGLTQIRCAECRVLHFACPECGHHQPINTLRPAFQRLLGRMRALGLTVIMFLKINFFFWILFAWAGLGTEVGYSHRYYNGNPGRQTAIYDTEGGVIIFILAAAFAAVGRMLLLRWRSGVLVGVTLAGLVALALMIGAHLEQSWHYQPLPSPMTFDFLLYLMCAFAGACIGGAIVWGIWFALAHAFLPKKTAVALIEWQRAMSENPASPVQSRKDATTSIIT